MSSIAEMAEARAQEKLRRAKVPIDTRNPDDGDGLDGIGTGDDLAPPIVGDDGIDDRASEIETLRAQLDQANQSLSALQGRLTPAQQALEAERAESRTLRLRIEQQERARQEEIDRLRAELDAKASALNIDDVLSAEEQADIDPAVLKAVAKLADHIVQRRAPKLDVRGEALRAIQERDEQRVQEFRQRLLIDPAHGLHNLDRLSADPAFVQWAQSEDVDLDSTLNSLLRAKTEEDVKRYAKIASRKVAQFHTQNKAGSTQRPPAGADPQARLAAGLRRGGEQRMTDAQRDTKLAEAKALARSTNPADRAKAKAIIDSLA